MKTLHCTASFRVWLELLSPNAFGLNCFRQTRSAWNKVSQTRLAEFHRQFAFGLGKTRMAWRLRQNANCPGRTRLAEFCANIYIYSLNKIRFVCLSVCWFQIGFYTVIDNETFYTSIQVKFYGGCFYLYFKSVQKSVEKLSGKMVYLVYLNLNHFWVNIWRREMSVGNQ